MKHSLVPKNVLKRFFLIIFLFLIPIVSKAQSNVLFCAYVDGYWSEWKGYRYYLYGNYGSILMYDEGHHPSEFVWRFTINNYMTPTKDQIKNHYKNNIWWEYQGTMEYYISDEYPNIKAQLLKFPFPCIAPWNHDTSKGQTPCVKRRVNAKIKIAPYKDHPRVYNIWFEGVGFGIDLYDTIFML